MTTDEKVSGDELLLAIAHDLRAYLRRNLAGAQMLDRACGAELAPEHRQLLENVVGAGKELERFLGRLSDYANASRLGSGRPIPLEAALQLAIQGFPCGDIRLSDGLAGSGASVPREFVRLFSELIDNGLKFSGGKPVTVRASGPNAVEIADVGIGIEPGDEERVLEPLVRLHARDKYSGFGLGLAISRRIAEAAGATLRIAANSGGGALAIVTLPEA